MAGEYTQEKEIATFKTDYDGHVRVIKGIGDFSHVVTVQPTNQDLYCKYQLTDAYPEDPPTINIRSSVLPEDLVATLTSELQKVAGNHLGKPMLFVLTKTVAKFVQAKDIDLTPHEEVREKGKKRGKGKRTKDSNKSKPYAEEGTSEKKSSMKTAADVIKRLQWDKSLPVEDFTVGYIDRFTGVEEKSFTAFSWEDFASVDQFTLAIPQHRIQYFKYKTEKIWDKNERLDNVFGSTGSKMTMIDTIKKYEEKLAELDDVEENMEVKEREVEDEDSDADINVLVEAANIFASDEPVNVRISSDSKKKSDFFLALRITDEEVLSKCEEIQKAILGHYPHFASHEVSKNGFHITLTVLCLESQENVGKCVEVLDKIKPKLLKLATCCAPLEFTGIDHFYNTVIYAKIKYSEEFLHFVDRIKAYLSEAGLNIHTDHGFNPHMTLFKCLRAARGNKDWPKTVLCLTPYSDVKFGTQQLDNLHLCQMGTMTEFSDFYTCAASYSFQQ